MRRVRQILKRRISPKRIWQAVLVAILLAGIFGFLSGLETALAQTWLEAMLARLK